MLSDAYFNLIFNRPKKTFYLCRKFEFLENCLIKIVIISWTKEKIRDETLRFLLNDLNYPDEQYYVSICPIFPFLKTPTKRYILRNPLFWSPWLADCLLKHCVSYRVMKSSQYRAVRHDILQCGYAYVLKYEPLSSPPF